MRFCYKRAMKILLLLIGMVLVLEGLPYAANPEKMQQWLRQLTEIPAEQLRVIGPAEQLRVIGMVSMAAGLLICFLVQKTSFF